MKLFPILAALLASKLAGSALPPSPYIYSIGRAERSVDADLVTIHVVVRGTATDYRSALTKMRGEASGVFSVLEAAQISLDDMASHEVSAEPQYERDDSRRTITGYSVFQRIDVTLRDVSKAADIITRILEKGVSTLQIGAPRSTKRTEAERELTAEAIRDARRRADEIAVETGMKVTSVYAVSPVSFGEIESSILQGEKRFKSFGVDGGALRFHVPKIRIDVAVHAVFTVEKP